MRTFNRNQELKNELLKKLKHHQELDAFIQGDWLTNEKVEGNGYKGCFYGCTMQTRKEPILKFSEKYSIDLWYCYLTENIFEGLPDGEYQKFPLQSIEILPIGFNINKIKSPFFYALLEDQLKYCQDDKVVTEVVKKCRDLFKVDFESIDESAARSAAEAAAWSAARSATRSATRSAAEAALWSTRSATRSAAESAAESAWSTRSTRSAAESAAEAAAWSAARSPSSTWSAAEKDYYIWLRDLLFCLIEEENNPK